MATMADLTDGIRVRHVTWGDEGSIIRHGDRVWVKWDGMCPPSEIYPAGSVEPGDLEILQGSDPDA